MSKSIHQLNFSDVDGLGDGIRYYDGEVALASDLRAAMAQLDVVSVNFAVMVFVVSGKLTVEVDGDQHSLRPQQGLFIGSRSAVRIMSMSDDLSCRTVGINAERGLVFIDRGVTEAFLQIKKHPVITFNSEEMELLLRYYELAIFKSDHSGVGSGRASAQNLLRAFVLELVHIVNKHVTGREKPILRQSDKIFRRFLRLLAESEGKQRSVSEFASQLCVSPKYLSGICRTVEGKTAGEIVTLNTVGHIKRRLIYSDMSIKEISIELGFHNLSFFGKYVKKHLGASPNNYRKQYQQQSIHDPK